MTALVLCRFAHFLAAMLTFGASGFLWVLAPERLRRELSPAIWRLTLAASLVALFTAIAWLMFESASMAGDEAAAFDPQAIGAVLADTAFGHAWAAHLIFASALAAMAVFGPRDRWAPTVAFSALLLASLGLVGHAAMQPGFEGVLHRANHAVHLVTAGAWIGGLVPFLMCLGAYRRADLRREAVVAMARFSFSGHFIVAAIVVTGAVNILLVSGRLPMPPDTIYRALLVAKLAVVAVMIALALLNRYGLTPRLKRDPRALDMMRVNATAEVALGALAIALVSAFALLDPA